MGTKADSYDNSRWRLDSLSTQILKVSLIQAAYWIMFKKTNRTEFNWFEQRPKNCPMEIWHIFFALL